MAGLVVAREDHALVARGALVGERDDVGRLDEVGAVPGADDQLHEDFLPLHDARIEAEGHVDVLTGVAGVAFYDASKT